MHTHMLTHTHTYTHTHAHAHIHACTQCRIYPDKKMLMIFDMTGAGLAQMDMDLVRFVVNSFKIYFPNILAGLLVYNMPWVLQGEFFWHNFVYWEVYHILSR